MQTAKLVLNDLLNNLEEEDYRTVIDFIEYLSADADRLIMMANIAVRKNFFIIFRV